MKTNQIQEIIRKVISEAKEDIKKKKETGLPKSSGKLVELKKELTSLKRMKESLPQSTVNEGDETTGSLTVEYAHMQKFVNEIEKIKAMTAKLSEMLGGQITEVEEKIKSETQKIKEMIGLVQPADKKVEEKKKPAAAPEKKKEEPKKVNELFGFGKKDENSLKINDKVSVDGQEGEWYVAQLLDNGKNINLKSNTKSPITVDSSKVHKI